MTPRPDPRFPRVTLKRVLDFTPAEWHVLYGFFRDRELADWNDAKPLRMPEWIFKRVMQDEEKRGDRAGFGILNERGELIIEEYENMLNERTKLVAVTHVSNSLGTVNPIKEMIQTAHKFGVPVFVDGAVMKVSSMPANHSNACGDARLDKLLRVTCIDEPPLCHHRDEPSSRDCSVHVGPGERGPAAVNARGSIQRRRAVMAESHA